LRKGKPLAPPWRSSDNISHFRVLMRRAKVFLPSGELEHWPAAPRCATYGFTPQRFSLFQGDVEPDAGSVVIPHHQALAASQS
jgi:hypothetical protein